MLQILKDQQTRIVERIWQVDTKQLSVWHARLIGMARIAWLTIRDLFFDSQLSLRAMSLVYTTLLSIVPLIAVSVSVLKGFGAHHQIELVLGNFLAPLGERGAEITNTIIQFVEGINSGLLGSLGLALLLYTVISLMQKIESAFNYTWRVSEVRSFARRFSDYLSVILIGPVLVFSAIGMTASITSSTLYMKLASYPVFSHMFGAVGHILPYLLIILAFTMVYIFVPNTKVKFRSAFVGAIVTGIIWQTVGWLFTSFISSANYTAIYSAFAALFFFMIWIYISWSIMLTGASIAFYFQHPEHRLLRRRELKLSNRMKEKLALAVMAQVASRYYSRQTPWTLQGVAAYLNIASESLHPIFDCLTEQRLLLRTDADPVQYIPGQAPEEMAALDIVRAIREAEEDEIMNLQHIPHSQKVEDLFGLYQDAASQALQGKTLKELVDIGDNIIQPITKSAHKS